MDIFSLFWFDVEGVVLIKLKIVYDDVERDMVSVKVYFIVDLI